MKFDNVEKVGFDAQVFWAEANSILAKGTRAMLINCRNQQGLEEAFNDMDLKLSDLIEVAQPPQEIVQSLDRKVRDRLGLVRNMMRSKNIDTDKLWSLEKKKIALIILKAVGHESEMPRLDTLVSDTAEFLTKGNFTKSGAERL